MGGVGNGAAEEDWRWDLNSGTAAIGGGGSRGFGAHFATWIRNLENPCEEARTVAGGPGEGAT